MPDICKCEDMACPMAYTCHRFIVPAHEFRQSYFHSSPRVGYDCDYYWDRQLPTYLLYEVRYDRLFLSNSKEAKGSVLIDQL